MRELAVGQVRRGVVTRITEYGLYVDLGGATGLVLVTDLSWADPMWPPADHYAVGDVIDVRVLDIDWGVGRLSLGVKQLTPNPYWGIAERYAPGTRVSGRVVSLPAYGAFIEVEPKVWALLPAAEIGDGVPSRHVALGDVLEGVVVQVDEDAEKIRLARPP